MLVTPEFRLGEPIFIIPFLFETGASRVFIHISFGPVLEVGIFV